MQNFQPMIPNINASETAQPASIQKQDIPQDPKVTTLTNNATLGTLILSTAGVTDSFTKDDASSDNATETEDSSSETDSFIVEGQQEHSSDSEGGSSGRGRGDSPENPCTEEESTGGTSSSGGTSSTGGTTPPIEAPISSSTNQIDLLKSLYNQEKGFAASGANNAEMASIHHMMTSMVSGFTLSPQMVTKEFTQHLASWRGFFQQNGMGFSQSTMNQMLLHWNNAQEISMRLLNDPPTSQALQTKMANSIYANQALAFQAMFQEMLANPASFQKAFAEGTSESFGTLATMTLQNFANGSFPLPNSSMIPLMQQAALAKGDASTSSSLGELLTKMDLNKMSKESPSVLTTSPGEGSMAAILGAFAASICTNEVESMQFSAAQATFLAQQGNFNIQESAQAIRNTEHDIHNLEVKQRDSMALQNFLKGFIITITVIAAVLLFALGVVTAGTSAALGAMLIVMSVAMVASMSASEAGKGNVVVDQIALSLEKDGLGKQDAQLVASIILAIVAMVATAGAAGIAAATECAEISVNLALQCALNAGLSTLSMTNGWSDFASSIATSTHMSGAAALALNIIMNVLGLLLTMGAQMATSSTAMAEKATKIAAAAAAASDVAQQTALAAGAAASDAAEAGDAAAQSVRSAASAAAATQMTQMTQMLMKAQMATQIVQGGVEGGINIDLGVMKMQMATQLENLAQNQLFAQVLGNITQLNTTFSQSIIESNQEILESLAQALADVVQNAPSGLSQSAQGLG